MGREYIRLNDFQKEVYEKACANEKISISAPTSAGKSFVLLRLIKDCFVNNPTAKIVYIVPTRALIQQVEIDIKAVLKEYQSTIEVTSIPVKPDRWRTTACIFIFTQERLQWILNDNPDISFDLMVIDEAQKIGDGARGVFTTAGFAGFNL